MEEDQKGSYGKRPIWQWILIYLVIGGLIYAAVYYFVSSGKGGYGYGGNSAPNQNTQPNQPRY